MVKPYNAQNGNLLSTVSELLFRRTKKACLQFSLCSVFMYFTTFVQIVNCNGESKRFYKYI